MRFAAITASLALASLAVAAPLERRNNTGSSITDADILQYALTLEHLEATFYKQAATKFNSGAFSSAGLPDWVRYRITEIASQERTHVNALSAGLTAAGVTPTQQCEYNFDAALADVKTYIATATLVEGIGTAAYLGAAPFVQSKAYLAIAGSILVVEAEHQTWLASAVGTMDGFPRAFYAPLTFNQVYTLVAPFIKSCPSSNPKLPVKAYPALTVSTAGPYSVGQKISVSAANGTSGKYVAFIDAVATQYAEINGSSGSVTIPSGFTGQGYIILTNDKATTDAATVAGPAVINVPVQATNFPY